MQQKQNIRLLVIWLVLVVVTLAIGLYKPSRNTLDIDKDHFALGERVNQITKISISSKHGDVNLTKKGRSWTLNESMSADMSKVNDLLGILSEVTVRRKISTAIDSLADTVKVTAYDELGAITSFVVSENETQTLTLFSDESTYVVSIPGYKYHIADLFKQSARAWRSKYVFASNWTTLDKMIINHPKNPDAGFEIQYDNQGYYIPGITQLDTAAMYDYMQQVSFLQLSAYVKPNPSLQIPDLSIVVKDVGDQQIALDFYLSGDVAIGRINRSEWAIFDKSELLPLFKNRSAFRKE